MDLASRGERAAAFLIDLFAIIVGFVGIVLLLVLIGVSGAEMGAWFWIMLMLVFFFLRSFYFAAFELRLARHDAGQAGVRPARHRPRRRRARAPMPSSPAT